MIQMCVLYEEDLGSTFQVKDQQEHKYGVSVKEKGKL